MTRHRVSSLIIMVALLASACGADDGPGGDEPNAVENNAAEPTVTPEAATTDAGDEEPLVEPTTAPDRAVEPSDAGPPAPGLPILTEHVFDEVVYSMVSVDGYVVAATGTGLVRLDIDTGEQVRVHLANADDPRLEPFWIAGGDHHVLIVNDRTWEGAIDVIASVDIRTMELVARIDDSAGIGADPAGAQGGVAVITYLASGLGLVDTATLEPHASGATLPGGEVLNLDGEIWHIEDDGSGGVIDIATGEARGTFDGSTGPGARFSGWELVGPDEVWFANGLEATLHRVDRQSLEVAGVVDLKEQYPDSVVDIVGGSPRDNLVELSVVQGGVQWLVIAALDPTTGDVLWDHAFSQFGTTAGFTVFERAAFTTMVDGRIFVRDHARRIVEVDTALVGTATGPWSAPELTVQPPLDESQQAVLDTVRRYLADPDSVDVSPSTDLRLAVASDAETWPARFVTIIDDRAYVRVWPGEGTDEIGVPVSLSRSGDSWAIDGRLVCYLAAFTPQQRAGCEA